MKTVSGGGSASLWQADKQRDWLTWEQNVSLQQQQLELKSEELRTKKERQAAVLGAKTEPDPPGTLSAYVWVCVRVCACWCIGMCLSVCINLVAFFSHCIITPLILTSLLGPPHSVNQTNHYMAQECACDLRKFLCVPCVRVCVCGVCVHKGTLVTSSHQAPLCTLTKSCIRARAN